MLPEANFESERNEPCRMDLKQNIIMLCRTYCGACIGVEVISVTIEVYVTHGINFFLVGLPDSAVKESQQRITTALSSIGARIPGKKIVINMAPADFRKEGSSFDLAIAVGILAASGQYRFPSLGSYLIMGELALDGSLRKIPGVLPIALHAKNEGFKGCIVPYDSAREIVEIAGISIYAVKSLTDVISVLEERGELLPFIPLPEIPRNSRSTKEIPDFCDIKGQEFAKRGLEIAAAGGHNILLCGGPGSGKSMMAKAFAGILPPMSNDEALETSVIYSVAGIFNQGRGLIRERPFRSPHHSSSVTAIAGGGAKALPGEISLSHNGVLYLDELSEFPRHILETLRQPLEDKCVTISRQRSKLTYPCNFMLVASMNPCPCGYYGQPGDRCRCTSYSIFKYLSKISGPLLDRIDMHIEVSPVPESLLLSDTKAEESREIRERVSRARNFQHERYGGRYGSNAMIGTVELSEYCKIGIDEKQFLETVLKKLNLSARAYSRILKVSRTIADLELSEFISLKHLSEAVLYRGIDRLYGYGESYF